MCALKHLFGRSGCGEEVCFHGHDRMLSRLTARFESFGRDIKRFNAKSCTYFSGTVRLRLRRRFYVMLTKQNEVCREENVRIGCTGTITTKPQCDSAAHDIYIISWAGYGPEGCNDDAPLSLTGNLRLVETVEKAAGNWDQYVPTQRTREHASPDASRRYSHYKLERVKGTRMAHLISYRECCIITLQSCSKLIIKKA